MSIRQNSIFYYNHLGASAKDREDIQTFSVRDSRGEGLVYYLQNDAFPDEEAGVMRTYLVRDNQTSELVGYFSLKAGLVSFNEMQTEAGPEFDTLPGIELANFAVNNEYIQKTPGLKGVGQIIFDELIMPLVVDVAERVGVKIICNCSEFVLFM